MQFLHIFLGHTFYCVSLRSMSPCHISSHRPVPLLMAIRFTGSMINLISYSEIRHRLPEQHDKIHHNQLLVIICAAKLEKNENPNGQHSRMRR